MAELLLIKPSDISKDTIIGGNVDIDKYNYSIFNTQVTVIEPLLGSELYDKIKADFGSSTLAGDYLKLYDDFIKPILKYQTTAEYIEVCSYTIDNGGIFKHQTENKTVPERKDIELLSGKYRGLAEVYINRFNKWICNNPLDEYKTVQDEVDAEQNSSVKSGFYFGDSQTGGKWD